MEQAAQHKAKTTQTDSLFGMALAQAFVGVVLGPAAHAAWEAGEIASAVRDDRRTNGDNGFKLGVKNSLGGIFTRTSHPEKTLAERERETFRPAAFARSSFAMQPAF